MYRIKSAAAISSSRAATMPTLPARCTLSVLRPASEVSTRMPFPVSRFPTAAPMLPGATIAITGAIELRPNVKDAYVMRGPTLHAGSKAELMNLFFAPGACSLSPHIVLRETGANFDLEQVNNKEKKTKSGQDYWSINPKGQVPTLELDNGQRLTEGPAIVQWIADQNPDAALIPPPGKFECYRVLEWLNFITSELHKTFGPFFKPTPPDAYKQISRETLEKRLDWLDKELAG